MPIAFTFVLANDLTGECAIGFKMMECISKALHEEHKEQEENKEQEEQA